MKTLTSRIFTLLGIALLAMAMVFAFVSCQPEPPNNPPPPEIPTALQNTEWTNSTGDKISFTTDSVTITPAGGQAQTFKLKDTSSISQSGISQTILYFKDNQSSDDTITYRDGKITMVNFSIIKQENRANGTNGWSKGGGSSGNPTAITYTVAQTGGTNNITTSTGIVFTFSASVDSLNLTAANITVSGAASKGSATLTGSGTSWTLSPITVNNAGTATVSINKTGIETGTKDVTVHKAGQVTPEYWSITWNLNGGEESAGAYPEQIIKGAVLAKPSPDPTKADNAFGGWYTNSGLTQPYNFASPVTADLNLYAKWEALQPPEGTPVSGSTLAEKLAWLSSNAVSNTTYTIEVSADETIGPNTLSYTGKNNITIILWGAGGEKVISLSQNGSLFTIGTDVTLVLDYNITLQGRSNNTNALVTINSAGKLIMKARAKIYNNFRSGWNVGGGVNVSGGTFTMTGGEIYGNSAYEGGGVGVTSNGTFTMEGGKISFNFGNIYGGVSVESGTFTMTGGEISDNSNGGVLVAAGTFTMKGGEISGNTDSNGVHVGGTGTFTMEGGKISGHSYGGGVSVVWDGTFTMKGGEISGNTRTYDDGGEVISGRGSGVYVSGGTFTKTGGTIYGYSADDTINSNVVKDDSGEVVNNQGHAVYVDVDSSTNRRRETTAGPTVNLDSTKSGTAGGWEN